MDACATLAKTRGRTKPFVTAAWSDVVLFTYAVPDEVVKPHVGDLQLDRWNDRAHVSIVVFYFSETRVLGVKPGPLLPTVNRFAQWNLRTYVRSEGEPGVIFIKEYVPSRMVVGAVRAFYNENYITAPVTMRQSRSEGLRKVQFDLKAGGQSHSIVVSTRGEPTARPLNSPHHFFAERYWGSPGGDACKTISFRVEHPPWRMYDVSSYLLRADYGALYGEDWNFLNDTSPDYVTWCEGSAVGISWPHRAKTGKLHLPGRAGTPIPR